MPTVKRIVCLANSRKLGGRCIAGREWRGGQAGAWIRPVTARPHEEVSEHERQYEDGSDPRVLDLVDIPLLEPRPRVWQQENWLLDPNAYWVRRGRVGWDDLAALADAPAALWHNGCSTYYGQNDRVPLHEASGLTTSLYLLRTDRVTLSVLAPGTAFGDPTRKVYGRFRHAGTEYRLRVTDPVYERAYLTQSDGDYHLGESYLTVSLGEEWEGYAYKLIAAIIEKAGSIGG
ncbi:MAG: hypothetical protein N2688_11720 [Burkholderiaceae bacterium]|nr:hypothetical protein [Burkholderiaceae bacterium]